MTGIPTGNGAGAGGAAGGVARPLYRVNRVAYWLLQWTWGIIQNLAALVVALCVRIGHPERRLFRFHGAVVVPWGQAGGSMGLGMFIFFGHRDREDAARVLVHEYGHTIQSCILGPLYLFVIGLPSLVWAWLPRFRADRRDGRRRYSDFYPEKWANYAGTRVTHRPAIDD